MIYLDNAATTFPKPAQVMREVQEMSEWQWMNAGRGSYKPARRATEKIEQCKKNLLKIAGSNPANSVVFAPSATIAMNMLIGGMHLEKKHIVYVSAYEHNAVMRPLHRRQQKTGFTIRQLPMDKETLCIDEEKLAYEFRQYPPDFICMTHISNVTGYILPVQRISRMAKSVNASAVIMVDGSQALGLVVEPLNDELVDDNSGYVKKTDAQAESIIGQVKMIDDYVEAIDYYVFAGHKTLYGVFGLGGFICNSRLAHQLISDMERFTPFLCGGTGSDSLNLQMNCSMPEGLETGSPNMLAVAGLLAATEGYLGNNESALDDNETEENSVQGKVIGKTERETKGKKEEIRKDEIKKKEIKKDEIQETEKTQVRMCDAVKLYEQECKKTQRLVEGLKEIEGVRLYIPKEDEHSSIENKHISIVSFNIEGYKADEVGMILDEDYEIAVRTGYHCAPLIHEWLKDKEYGGTVRASVGRFTTEQEINRLLEAVEELAGEV